MPGEEREADFAPTHEERPPERAFREVGDGGLEPPTSSLSEKRSNRLS
jgi:hypothetical protein